MQRSFVYSILKWISSDKQECTYRWFCSINNDFSLTSKVTHSHRSDKCDEYVTDALKTMINVWKYVQATAIQTMTMNMKFNISTRAAS